MLPKLTAILVLLSLLLSQAQACLRMSARQVWATNLYTIEVIDNDRSICKRQWEMLPSSIKFLECVPGFAAYLVPDMSKLIYITNTNHYQLTVQSSRTAFNQDGDPFATDWRGNWFGRV